MEGLEVEKENSQEQMQQQSILVLLIMKILQHSYTE